MSVKNKRDLFRFNGVKPIVINLEHVTNMQIDGIRITVTFYSNSIFVEMENEDAAKLSFEQLLNIWSSPEEVPPSRKSLWRK